MSVLLLNPSDMALNGEIEESKQVNISEPGDLGGKSTYTLRREVLCMAFGTG